MCTRTRYHPLNVGPQAAPHTDILDIMTHDFADSVSSLEFSPKKQSLNNYGGNITEVLLSGHWDNSVHIWTINTTGNPQCSPQMVNDISSDVPILAMQGITKGPMGNKHQGPVLDVAWHGDCMRYFY